MRPWPLRGLLATGGAWVVIGAVLLWRADAREGAAAGVGAVVSTATVGPFRPAMVLLPAGRFVMGSPATEVGRDADEAEHEVEIAQAFYIGLTEVTQAQWVAVMGRSPSKFVGPERPVENLTWYAAGEYLNRLSEREGLEPCYARGGCEGDPAAGRYGCPPARFAPPSCRGYRLPTEAEWEYAARAGTRTPIYSGPMDLSEDGRTSEAVSRIGWYFDNSGVETLPVGQKIPNGWGLYDVIGNVSEWVDGRIVPDSENVVEARGCSFIVGDARSCRVANRTAVKPSRYSVDLGFRPARSASP